VSYRITWIDAQRSFEATGDETVLEAAQRAGVTLPSECGFGGCGTCRVKLLAGHVHYAEPPMALSPEETEAGYALMCQARALADLQISTERVLGAPVPPQRRTATVLRTEALSADVTRLVLALDNRERLVFRPGQYLNVLPGDAGARSFSMASRTGDAEIELHIRRIDGGYFTQDLLSAMRSGDTLEIDAPLGGFGYHEEDYRPIVMVATGTGIAPLRSLLATMFDDPGLPPVDLYWGGRTRADLYLHGELAQLAATREDFRFVPVLSRADDAWPGARGYVQDAVLADYPDLSEHALYLCGSPAMIADARRAFGSHGASVRYLYADSFTFQHPHYVDAAG
jgi:CDP-4-dehydro-6-deoxyglucose reductase